MDNAKIYDIVEITLMGQDNCYQQAEEKPEQQLYDMTSKN